MAMYDPLRVSEETLRTLAEIMERFERKPSEDTLVTLVMHKIPGGEPAEYYRGLATAYVHLGGDGEINLPPGTTVTLGGRQITGEELVFVLSLLAARAAQLYIHGIS
jgi:hypothetical protein